jgi:hypothetical protein
MSFDSRIGLAALIMAFVGIAVPIIWPDPKWVGWICLLIAAALSAWWVWLETDVQEIEETKKVLASVK